MLTAGDLRAEIGRSRVPIYVLAAEIGLHPSRLGQMLNEKVPMSPDVASRVGEALATHRDDA
jgi:plasmid maintenance system antidote protein VapI